MCPGRFQWVTWFWQDMKGLGCLPWVSKDLVGSWQVLKGLFGFVQILFLAGLAGS